MKSLTQLHHIIDKKSGIPLYKQVADFIFNNIQYGYWRVGDRLPSEPTLAEQLNVSRSTIRQAILDLEQNGLLVRKQGAGTYVSRSSRADAFISFSFPPELGGFHKLIEQLDISCDTALATTLDIPVGTTVYLMCLLRYVRNNEIAGLEKIYLKKEYADMLPLDTVHNLTREFIHENCHVDFIKVDLKLKPIVLTPSDADPLQVSPGEAALCLKRIYYTYNSVPVYYTENIILSSFCEELILKNNVSAL